MIMHNPPHPGRVLKDYIEGRSVTEVAKHIGVSRVNLSRLLNEQAGVSAEMSLKLADALGTSPEFWFKMQMNYDLWQAAQKKRKRIAPLGRVA
jgi:addiction module HigA family antidote